MECKREESTMAAKSSVLANTVTVCHLPKERNEGNEGNMLISVLDIKV